MTVLQLAHVCGLLGVLNFFVLSAARKHLHSHVALQEKIVGALLTPLVVGDFLHLYVTLWALGEHKWEVRKIQHDDVVHVDIGPEFDGAQDNMAPRHRALCG